MRKIALFIALLLFVGISIADNPHTPRGPIIVADVPLMAQTGLIQQATLFTPANAGLYRITAYAEASAQPTGQIGVSLNWADDFSTNNFAFVLNGGFPAQGSVTIYSVAGSPVTFQSSPGGLSTGETYNLFFVVEQL